MQKILRQKSLLLFIFLLLIGTFFRFYKIRHTMQFLGDQGRDALIARRIMFERQPALIGPVTSVGNMYLGPFYYYFMVFPLLLSYPDPIGPTLAVAFVGVMTLALIYVVGKKMFGKEIAFISMAIYAISPIVVTNVRFSWNPNIVPFFSVLLVYCLYLSLKGNRKIWGWVGLLCAILLQLHYITLILIMSAFFVWIFDLGKQLRSKNFSRDFFVTTLIGILIGIASLFPLVAFDFRHDHSIAKAFQSFFDKPAGESHFRKVSELSALFYASVGLYLRNIFEGFGLKLPQNGGYIGILVSLYLLIRGAFFGQEKKYKRSKVFISLVFLFSLFIFSFYRESIFDHYLGFMFPIGTFVLAIMIYALWENIFLRPFAISVLALIVIFSLRNYPGQHTLGLNVDVFRETAEQIQSRVQDGQSYDILLLTENNDFLGMNYRYFLTTMKYVPAKEEDIWTFKRLFVIDERRSKNPLDTPQYKVAVWPNRDIVDEFTIENGAHVVVLER